ncbi:MAG: FmdB family zinc ribbon protein [Candidatus Kapaibacterium sp.]
MPIYEYQCKKCGKVFEYMQKMSDEPLKTCPEDVCSRNGDGHGEVVRLISKNVGLKFNGSGFYLTDYARKHTSAAPAETPAAESKPAADTPKNGAAKETAKS